MSDNTKTRPIDPRMQVIIDLIPVDAPMFRVTHGNPLYWRPNSSGYVSEYNPFWAGFYAHSTHYADGKSDHSREVQAVDALRGISVPDGCLMAMLVDALTQTRAELAETKKQPTWSTAWPTEPGWYWVRHRANKPAPAHVYVDKGHVVRYVHEAFAHPSDPYWADLHWGPRIAEVE